MQTTRIPSRPMAGWLGLIFQFIFLGVAASAGTPPDYQLELTLDPPEHRLETVATVTLPAGKAGQTVEFVLAASLAISGSSVPVETLPPRPGDEVFVGINGISETLASRRGVRRYRLTLPAGQSGFRLEYAGLVDMPPETSPEEYARSFSETPGIIEPRGAYLSGSTLWYPQLTDDPDSALVTYTLSVNTPPGWHLIAPGDGDSGGADGRAHWHSPSPVDEISLSGGPLTPYALEVDTMTGPVQAQVFLREPDPALAAKYLEATSRYLRMYNNLLGPYPYRKFALVENFWETGYGMPSYTLLGPQIIRFPFILTSSYPHEILHNWWGNSVYVDYATGNWCEGLTAYLADHLLKEVEGQGAEYRRDVLKKYRDFAATGNDFPLRDFRVRHSAATEAVGYGKTLMGFHMLRRQMGDEAFRKSLANFYKTYRGQRASFDDVRSAFESSSGLDLSVFFNEWVNRAGAPDLAVQNVKLRQTDGGYSISGVLVQRQPNVFAATVPVVVSTRAGLESVRVRSDAARMPFSIETRDRPLTLAVDPEFDVFRILDPRETAPSIGQLFGAPRVTAVLPGDPSEAQAWRAALAAWQTPANQITIVTDRELQKIPADRSVWLLGRSNRLAPALFSSEPALGLAVSPDGISVAGKEIPFAGHSHVLTRRHPGDISLAVGWITADPAAAIAGLGRKLPHYGKYSWLAFAGEEPANVAKGEWPAVDSPLLVNLQPAGTPLALPPAEKRRPLAEPPAAYSEEALMQHVTWLAAPERAGRGFGSTGLEASAEYIRDQFVQAGLKPGAGGSSYFQEFTAVGGADKKEHKLRNVIGVLPGSDPRFKDEVAVLTAHYDHLGLGWPDARADAIGKIHPGADDNASGVAVMIEVARQLASGPPPPRTIVFIAFSAEESGLLGSRYYVKNPTPAPLGGIVGNINIDTVGSLGDQPVSALATESAREWPFVFSGITAVTGVATRSVPGSGVSSDQQAFIDAGIPGVQIFARASLDYHRTTDTADKVDAAGLVKVATVVTEAINYLASTEQRLTVTGRGTGSGAPPPAASGDRRRVSLGTIPDFAFQGPGMRLDGVVPDSPAEKAGMKAGDILVRLGGDPVTGLSGFNEVLRKHQPGEKVELEWTRDGVPGQATVELSTR